MSEYEPISTLAQARKEKERLEKEERLENISPFMASNRTDNSRWSSRYGFRCRITRNSLTP